MLPIAPRCVLASAVLFAALPGVCSAQESTSVPRLLTSKEGRSVVAAAWEHREQVRRRPDCSHLVHQVYEFAGFPYPYASSFDLYDGMDSFRRVTTPRPGDLVVWPGHVGIVVDTIEHTFYSSVRSGMTTEYWDGAYWSAQGRPRFFRYVRGAGGTLLAAKESSRTTAPESRSRSGSSPTRRGASEDAGDKSSSEDSDEVAAGPAPPRDRPVEIPSSILVASTANRPTADEVSDAVSELASASGNLLRTGPPLDPQRPVSIYDQFTVERLEFKRDRAWVHVRVATRLSIAGEKFDPKRRPEKLRLELRRTPQGWQLQAPPNRAYVPRDVAVHVLASQLALLSQDAATAGENGPPRDAATAQERPAAHASGVPTERPQRRKYLIVRALAALVDPE